MQDMTMIWNAILTMAIGGFLWWIRTTSASITKIREEGLGNREHIALTYATKQEGMKRGCFDTSTNYCI